jgi:hypothetical protein
LAIRHCQCCNRRSPCWCLSGLIFQAVMTLQVMHLWQDSSFTLIFPWCTCIAGLVPIEMYISQKKIGRWTSQWLARASDFQYELPRDHHSCSLLALLPGLCWISKLTSHAFKSSYRGLRERAMNWLYAFQAVNLVSSLYSSVVSISTYIELLRVQQGLMYLSQSTRYLRRRFHFVSHQFTSYSVQVLGKKSLCCWDPGKRNA